MLSAHSEPPGGLSVLQPRGMTHVSLFSCCDQEDQGIACSCWPLLCSQTVSSQTLLVLLERVFPRLHFLSRNLKRDSEGLGEVPCVPRQTAHFTSFPCRTMRLLVSVCYLSMGIPCSACLQLVFKASSRDTCQFSNLDSENLVAEAEEPARLGHWRIHVAWRRASMGLPSRTGTLATVPSQDWPRISRSQAATCVPPALS